MSRADLLHGAGMFKGGHMLEISRLVRRTHHNFPILNLRKHVSLAEMFEKNYERRKLIRHIAPPYFILRAYQASGTWSMVQS
jgi:hypothetical protein